MLDFTWPHPLTLDQRARLSLPAPAREGHAETDGTVSFMVGILPGEGCIWLLTLPQFKAFNDRFQAWVGDNKEGRRLKSVMRSSFSRVSADAQGRVTIPQEMLTTATVTKAVTLVGQDDRVEIWATEALAALRINHMPEVLGLLESVLTREADGKNALAAGSNARVGEGKGPQA